MNGEPTRWPELPILCPHCGNHGEDGGEWEANGVTPFRLVEEVVRTWSFTAERDASGALSLSADTSNDKVDWESGMDLRIECGQCFGDFPLPEGARVEFE